MMKQSPLYLGAGINAHIVLNRKAIPVVNIKGINYSSSSGLVCNIPSLDLVGTSVFINYLYIPFIHFGSTVIDKSPQSTIDHNFHPTPSVYAPLAIKHRIIYNPVKIENGEVIQVGVDPYSNFGHMYSYPSVNITGMTDSTHGPIHMFAKNRNKLEVLAYTTEDIEYVAALRKYTGRLLGAYMPRDVFFVMEDYRGAGSGLFTHTDIQNTVGPYVNVPLMPAHYIPLKQASRVVDNSSLLLRMPMYYHESMAHKVKSMIVVQQPSGESKYVEALSPNIVLSVGAQNGSPKNSEARQEFVLDLDKVMEFASEYNDQCKGLEENEHLVNTLFNVAADAVSSELNNIYNGMNSAIANIVKKSATYEELKAELNKYVGKVLALWATDSIVLDKYKMVKPPINVEGVLTTLKFENTTGMVLSEFMEKLALISYYGHREAVQSPATAHAKLMPAIVQNVRRMLVDEQGVNGLSINSVTVANALAQQLKLLIIRELMVVGLQEAIVRAIDHAIREAKVGEEVTEPIIELMLGNALHIRTNFTDVGITLEAYAIKTFSSSSKEQERALIVNSTGDNLVDCLYFVFEGTRAQIQVNHETIKTSGLEETTVTTPISGETTWFIAPMAQVGADLRRLFGAGLIGLSFAIDQGTSPDVLVHRYSSIVRAEEFCSTYPEQVDILDAVYDGLAKGMLPFFLVKPINVKGFSFNLDKMRAENDPRREVARVYYNGFRGISFSSHMPAHIILMFGGTYSAYLDRIRSTVTLPNAEQYTLAKIYQFCGDTRNISKILTTMTENNIPSDDKIVTQVVQAMVEIGGKMQDLDVHDGVLNIPKNCTNVTRSFSTEDTIDEAIILSAAQSDQSNGLSSGLRTSGGKYHHIPVHCSEDYKLGYDINIFHERASYGHRVRSVFNTFGVFTLDNKTEDFFSSIGTVLSSKNSKFDTYNSLVISIGFANFLSIMKSAVPLKYEPMFENERKVFAEQDMHAPVVDPHLLLMWAKGAGNKIESVKSALTIEVALKNKHTLLAGFLQDIKDLMLNSKSTIQAVAQIVEENTRAAFLDRQSMRAFIPDYCYMDGVSLATEEHNPFLKPNNYYYKVSWATRHRKQDPGFEKTGIDNIPVNNFAVTKNSNLSSEQLLAEMFDGKNIVHSALAITPYEFRRFHWRVGPHAARQIVHIKVDKYNHVDFYNHRAVNIAGAFKPLALVESNLLFPIELTTECAATATKIGKLIRNSVEELLGISELIKLNYGYYVDTDRVLRRDIPVMYTALTNAADIIADDDDWPRTMGAMLNSNELERFANINTGKKLSYKELEEYLTSIFKNSYSGVRINKYTFTKNMNIVGLTTLAHLLWRLKAVSPTGNTPVIERRTNVLNINHRRYTNSVALFNLNPEQYRHLFNEVIATDLAEANGFQQSELDTIPPANTLLKMVPIHHLVYVVDVASSYAFNYHTEYVLPVTNNRLYTLCKVAEQLKMPFVANDFTEGIGLAKAARELFDLCLYMSPNHSVPQVRFKDTDELGAYEIKLLKKTKASLNVDQSIDLLGELVALLEFVESETKIPNKKGGMVIPRLQWRKLLDVVFSHTTYGVLYHLITSRRKSEDKVLAPINSSGALVLLMSNANDRKVFKYLLENKSCMAGDDLFQAKSHLDPSKYTFELNLAEWRLRNNSLFTVFKPFSEWMLRRYFKVFERPSPVPVRSTYRAGWHDSLQEVEAATAKYLCFINMNGLSIKLENTGMRLLTGNAVRNIANHNFNSRSGKVLNKFYAEVQAFKNRVSMISSHTGLLSKNFMHLMNNAWHATPLAEGCKDISIVTTYSGYPTKDYRYILTRSHNKLSNVSVSPTSVTYGLVTYANTRYKLFNNRMKSYIELKKDVLNGVVLDATQTTTLLWIDEDIRRLKLDGVYGRNFFGGWPNFGMSGSPSWLKALSSCETPKINYDKVNEARTLAHAIEFCLDQANMKEIITGLPLVGYMCSNSVDLESLLDTISLVSCNEAWSMGFTEPEVLKHKRDTTYADRWGEVISVRSMKSLAPKRFYVNRQHFALDLTFTKTMASIVTKFDTTDGKLLTQYVDAFIPIRKNGPMTNVKELLEQFYEGIGLDELRTGFTDTMSVDNLYLSIDANYYLDKVIKKNKNG